MGTEYIAFELEGTNNHQFSQSWMKEQLKSVKGCKTQNSEKNK